MANHPGKTSVYEIRVLGHLGGEWTDWFEGLSITQEEAGTTRISGAVDDQAALYGLLKRVRDLGMSLVSVTRIEPGHAREQKINATSFGGNP